MLVTQVYHGAGYLTPAKKGGESPTVINGQSASSDRVNQSTN